MTDDQNRLSWPGETAPAAPPAWGAQPGAATEPAPSRTYEPARAYEAVADEPGAPAASGSNAELTELVRMQKQLRLELTEIGDAVHRLAQQHTLAAETPSVDTAALEAAVAELGAAVSRLSDQSAQTGSVLADVLRALAAETKARNDDMESVRDLLDKLLAQGA